MFFLQRENHEHNHRYYNTITAATATTTTEGIGRQLCITKQDQKKNNKMAQQPSAQELEIIKQFQKLTEEQNSIANKIAEYEMEKREHESVLEALKQLNDDRKCYRLVGGVLVERTKAQIVPAVEENIQNLEDALKKLNYALKEKAEEVENFKTQYKIRFKDEQSASVAASAKKDTGKEDQKTTGVLA
jgi:prefoldin subunit 2